MQIMRTFAPPALRIRSSAATALPPVASRVKGARYVDIREGDAIDEARMGNWVKQAAALPGWVPGGPS